MLRNHKALTTLAGCLLTICCFGSGSLAAPPANPTAGPGFILAEEHPEAYFFIKMIQAGSIDYAVVNRSFAADVEDVETAGFVPYLAPNRNLIGYGVKGKTLELVGLDRPIYVAGRALPEGRWTVEFPPTMLFFMHRMPKELGGGMQKTYNFRGAEFLEQGYSLEETGVFIRRDLLLNTLVWSMLEYMSVVDGAQVDTWSPPADFAELESFIGAERNPAFWSHVQEVPTIQEVESAPGNFFAGYSVGHRKWVIRMNLGPEVREWPFLWSDKEGSWMSGRLFHY